VAAALSLVTTPACVVLAGDLPFPEGLPAVLRKALAGSGAETVVPQDAAGRRQPLAAAYDTVALRRALAGIGSPHGTAFGAVLDRLRVVPIDPSGLTDLPAHALDDVDTPADLAAARRREPHMLDDWTRDLADRLGVDLPVDAGLLLDVARDAAHAVSRPAAPLTTFLVGYAAALNGGGPEAVEDAARTAQELAVSWSPPAAATPSEPV
jgi:hypothetical protein